MRQRRGVKRSPWEPDPELNARKTKSHSTAGFDADPFRGEATTPSTLDLSQAALRFSFQCLLSFGCVLAFYHRVLRQSHCSAELV
jgi:hypothetical protein